MRSFDEFIKEINGSEALQKEFDAIWDIEALEAFLKKNDCGFTAEEFAAYIKEKSEGRIADDAAEAAAGGFDLFSKEFWTEVGKYL